MILDPYPNIINQRYAIRIGTNQIESYNHCFPSSCTSYLNYIGLLKKKLSLRSMTEYSYNNIIYGIAHSNLLDSLRKTRSEFKSKTNGEIISEMIRTKGEKYFTELIEKKYDHNDRYVWDTHETAINVLIKEFGIKVKRVVATDTEIKNQLDKGFPVIAGFDIRKPLDRSNKMGHIVLITGYSTSGYSIGDPYGNPSLKYKDTDGYQVDISIKDLYDLFPKGSNMFRTVEI